MYYMQGLFLYLYNYDVGLGLLRPVHTEYTLTERRDEKGIMNSLNYHTRPWSRVISFKEFLKMLMLLLRTILLGSLFQSTRSYERAWKGF